MCTCFPLVCGRLGKQVQGGLSTISAMVQTCVANVSLVRHSGREGSGGDRGCTLRRTSIHHSIAGPSSAIPPVTGGGPVEMLPGLNCSLGGKDVLRSR
eukprot:4145323-Pleurochrysis_carterae.AAC.2